MPTEQATSRAWKPLAVAAGSVLFVLAATLNAGGYRYGASDQAFYIPAVLRHLDGALFPRDWALLGQQDHFNVFTAAAAGVVAVTGMTLPRLFFVLYLLGLLALLGAACVMGRRLYRSSWTVVALTATLTLRHAIGLGAVNTLEGYMHPRMLAFGVGSLAVAACLRRRPILALSLVALAFLLHPTTAMWFALWVGVAVAAADSRFTWPAIAAALVASLLGAWAIAAGPLAGRWTTMDEAWLSVLGSKRYLFPAAWPLSGWLPVVFTPLVAGWLYALRRARGLVFAEERGVAAGAAVLLVAFLASLPFTAARVAFAVQLQVPRTLWLVDLLAVVYLVWYLAEGAPWAAHDEGRRAARATALVLVALSFGRGAYTLFVQHPERRLAAIGLPADEWNDALSWMKGNTAKDAWVLAAPGHAWQYGTSVRVGAHRDVYLEEAKDTAMAMYSREAAMTVLDRIRRTPDVDTLTADTARAFATETGVDLLVTERRIALPVLYANSRFKVYKLR